MNYGSNFRFNLLDPGYVNQADSLGIECYILNLLAQGRIGPYVILLLCVSISHFQCVWR